MPRILVVDDDASIRTTIEHVLRRAGYDAIAAPCGQAGLEAVEAFAFDLVIVDMLMPGIDGLQTIEALSRTAPDVPIIAMSGFFFDRSLGPAPDLLGLATTIGVNYCLHKPFRNEELLAAVSGCLEAARAHRQLRAG